MENRGLGRAFVIAFAAIALLGFIDASYLTVKFYDSAPLNCSILDGCELVTNSKYAAVGTIPNALLGSFYYLLLFLAGVFYLDRKSLKVLRLAFYSTWIGLLISAYFVFLQLFILEAICLYCMASALTSTTLFVMAMLGLKKLP